MPSFTVAACQVPNGWVKKEDFASKGRIVDNSYRINAKIERPFGLLERFGRICLGVISTIATLGMAPLFSKTIRNFVIKTKETRRFAEVLEKPKSDKKSPEIPVQSEPKTQEVEKVRKKIQLVLPEPILRGFGEALASALNNQVDVEEKKQEDVTSDHPVLIAMHANSRMKVIVDIAKPTIDACKKAGADFSFLCVRFTTSRAPDSVSSFDYEGKKITVLNLHSKPEFGPNKSLNFTHAAVAELNKDSLGQLLVSATL